MANIEKIVEELSSLTVMEAAELSKALEGIEELKKGCDSVITILNQATN